MTPTCRSSSRCASILCEACCWRYALRIARRIQAYDPRQLYALDIACSITDPFAFRRWRKSVHNVFAYQRRQSRWWPNVGFWAWWTAIGLHGVVKLDSITPTEFVSALRRHGDVRLRPIAIETVRTEVYRAAQSVSPLQRCDAGGRYQRVKIAIEPVIVAASIVPIVGNRAIMPMPIIV